MHNLFSKSFFRKATLAFFSLASFTLTSCDDDDFETPEPTPVTYVSFYHGSPDAPDMDLQINSKVINNQPFKYATFSSYLALAPESYNVKFTPVGAANAYLDSTLTFKDGKAYSLFAVNLLQNMDLLVVQDSIKAPATGKAALRIVHLSPDAPAVDVSTTGTSATTLVSDLSFKGITEFMEIDGAKYSLVVKAADSDETLLTISDRELIGGYTYTLIIRGFATPPTGSTNALSAQVIRNY